MRLTSCLIALAFLCLPVGADEPITVKIGNTDIKISIPASMAEMPKDETTTKALADITPPDCLLLRSAINADALDASKPKDPMTPEMHSFVFALKDVPQDIFSGDFIEYVQQIAGDVAHGVLRSQNSSFDFVETQKRLEQFQKDTGIAEQDDSDLYSLGMVSRSGACVSYMTAQYVMTNFRGKQQREKCLRVEAYLLLKGKVVRCVTELMGPSILSGDLLTLKHAAEKYQLDLQILNNE